MQDWHNETNETDFSGNEGFTYRIDYTDGSYYYGKKNFLSRTTLPPLKGYKRKRKVVKESNWRKYKGSSKHGKLKCVQKKTILKLFKTKGALTYGEVELLVTERVLFKLDCLNDNISGKFYAKNIGRKKIKWREHG